MNANPAPLDLKMELSETSTPHPNPSVKPESQEQALPLHTSNTQTGENSQQSLTDERPTAAPSFSNPTANGNENGNTSREGSSAVSSAPEDAPMPESDNEHYASDNEPELGDNGPPSKKKKGQRFFCTDFPPCHLSFTRSEHLARHIRKHTGERPFQCHCSRRFSRLDNLRQHAQTVHVNEDIPGDSLAATGTRFQRQIRTDRVRPQGRARAGTAGSQGGHSRGHARNLSTSSIASTMSTFSQAQDPRRRPPPLMMANDGAARARLSLETMPPAPKTPPGQVHGYTTQSPATLYTPSSATTYAVGESASPFYASPASTTSAFWGDHVPGRRLSVPSGTRPFESPHANSYPPIHPRQPVPVTRPYAPGESPFASSPVSHTPQDAPGTSPTDGDWRRRTWHPSTGFARPATSGLWFQQSAENPPPVVVPNPQSMPNQQPPTLPGIESFDQMQQSPLAPPRREPTPMQIDRPDQPVPSASRPFAPSFEAPVPTTRPQPPISRPGHRRGYLSLDMTLQRGLTKLDIRGNTPQMDTAQWGQQEPQNAGSQPVTTGQTEALLPVPVLPAQNTQITSSGPYLDASARNPPKLNKRRAWYNGPTADFPQQELPVRNSNAPSELPSNGAPRPTVDHLATVAQNESEMRRHSFAPVDVTQAPSFPQRSSLVGNSEQKSGFYSSSPDDRGMGRLEALVAVATGESNGRIL